MIEGELTSGYRLSSSAKIVDEQSQLLWHMKGDTLGMSTVTSGGTSMGTKLVEHISRWMYQYSASSYPASK